MSNEDQTLVEEFHRTLLRVAQQCRHQLNKSEVAALDRLATTYGYTPAFIGLTTLYASLQNGARFPSFETFKLAITKAAGIAEVSDDTIAEDTANRILRMIAKKGRRWADDFWEKDDTPEPGCAAWEINYVKFHEQQEREIGEVGKAVVQKMGGWHVVCEEGFMTSDFKMLRAQIKRLALSVLELARAGQLDRPASLPKPIERAQIGSSTKQLERADFKSLIPKPPERK